MTTLIAGMQNSVLVLESSKTGWKIHEDLKGSHPQGIAFDHRNPNRAYVVHLVMVCGKLMTVGKLGIVLERIKS